MMLSLVICSRDDARFGRAEAAYRAALSSVQHEIIRIPDARGMSEGYSRGIARTRGELLLLSHDDVELLSPDAFAPRLFGHMERFDLIGIAGTTRTVGPGWSMAGPPHLYGQVAHENANAPLRVNIFSAPARFVGGVQALDGVLMC